MKTLSLLATPLVAGALLAPGALAASAAPIPEVPPANATVSITFQVDNYMPRTAAQAAVVNKLDDDDVLKYREDRALWGHSAWQIITVKVPASLYISGDDEEFYAYVAKAINAKTNAKVGDLPTSFQDGVRYVGGVKANQKITIAWIMNEKATAKAPWGAKKNLDQGFFGASYAKKF